jgi:hypothetical protein
MINRLKYWIFERLAKTHLLRAGELIKQGELNAAEAILEGLLDSAADNVPALTLIAEIASSRKDWELAACRWGKVISICSQKSVEVPAKAYLKLEKARLSRAGEFIKQGELDAAEAMLGGVLDSAPDNVAALTLLAEIASQRESWNIALDLWERARKLAGGDCDELPRMKTQIEVCRAIASLSSKDTQGRESCMKLILIGGSPSSGTTVLLNNLSAPANFFGINESGLFAHPGIYSDYESFSANFSSSLIAFKKLDEGMRLKRGLSSHAIASSRVLNRYGLTLDDCLLLLRGANSGREYVMSLARVFAAHAEQTPDVVIEKMPGNIYAMPYFLDNYKAFGGVCVIRSPIDTVSSLAARGVPLLRGMAIWIVEASLALKIRSCSNGIIVRYEDFVSDSEAVIKSIYSKLNICPSMSLRTLSNINMKWPSEWRNSPLAKPSASSVGCGLKECDDIDRAIFSGLTLRDYPGTLLDEYIGFTAEELARMLGYSISSLDCVDQVRRDCRLRYLRQNARVLTQSESRSSFYEGLLL